MAEYIKKEDIEQKIQDGLNNLVFGHDAIEVLGMIYEIPPADVAPVVHGRWIYDKKAQRPYCSVCKGYFYGATNSPMSYDPSCGAKMDGEP